MLGRLIDHRYRIQSQLGAGGFGRTYLAQDTRRPGQPLCVVKQLVLAADPTQRELARRLFRQEAEILERLGEHDQIPRLLAYCEEGEEFFLVQAYIEGISLEQELAHDPPWNETQVLRFLQDVLTTLAFVHSQNVIHRDIKPSNLLQRYSDQKIVLLDFGAVKRIPNGDTPSDALTTLGLGTTGYAPLEQLEGRPRPASDLYALGIVAIQAVTGVLPLQLAEDVQGELVWQAPHLDASLVAVIRRMTRRYYWDRYDRAAAVLRDLATVAQHLEEPPETLLLPKPGNSQGDILLVDDQLERLRWLSLALTEQGFTVRSAVDSRLALAALRSQPPDLLLVAANLPGMDGYELCQRCHSQPSLATLPMILLGDSTEAWATVKAFSAGAVDYVPRPFKVLELIARIECRLQQKNWHKPKPVYAWKQNAVRIWNEGSTNTCPRKAPKMNHFPDR